VGRDRKEIDVGKLLEFGQRNIPQREVAEELGVSIPTLQKRMSEITDKQGILLRYRELQSLQLTSIQARILEHITPEKIQEASLRDLILAFKVLKDKELGLDGKPTEIKGLIHYLIEIEKKENAAACEEYTDAEFDEASEAAGAVTAIPENLDKDVEHPNFMPKL